jgi:hypothetical protein
MTLLGRGRRPVAVLSGPTTRRIVMIASLLMSLQRPLAAAVRRNRDAHRRAPHVSMLLRVPSQGERHNGLLDGRILTLEEQGGTARPSPLAMTKAIMRALKRGIVGGTMKTDSDDKSNRLTWTAGGVPLTSLPTNSSLMPYNCHVADRLPGDPASIYRFTLLSIRF